MVTARLQGERGFLVETRSGHQLLVEGGTDPGTCTVGPGPMELMLVSLAACAGATVADFLAKMRQPLDDLQVLAAGERAAEPPRVWTRIHLTYRVRGEVEERRVQRAVELAETRYCSASVMLRQVSRLTHQLQVIRSVDPALTRPLRRQVLRPHQTLEELVHPGEEDPRTVFFAALEEGEVVGCAGLFRESPPDRPGLAGAWRLRSMATHPSVRGTGLGGMILQACLDHVRREGGALLWCSARTTAADFYRRHGFEPFSEVYEVPGLGPHVDMRLEPG